MVKTGTPDLAVSDLEPGSKNQNMTLPPKAWYTLNEGASHIAAAAGKPVTVSQVIDWGAQKKYGLYLQKKCSIKYERGTRIVEINGDGVKIFPNAHQAVALVNGNLIQVDCGEHLGQKCLLMSQASHSRRAPTEWVQKPVSFDSTSVLLRGEELSTFVASLPRPAPTYEVGARWPAHETKALTALRLAAVKWWAQYDPSQPDTAPTNETVTAWLVAEHGVSATLASSMATILRADDLKLGPRKSS